MRLAVHHGADPSVQISMTTSGRHQLDAIQSLRCVAAVLVVAYHSFLAIRAFDACYWVPGDAAFLAGHYPAAVNHLSVGVDIFFCISGFIMCMLAQRARGGEAWSFLRDRAARILPPYWFFSSFIVVAMLLKPSLRLEGLSGDWGLDLPVVVRSFLLLPQERGPVLGVGWTLIQEFFFYELVFLVILVGRGRQAVAFIGMAALAGTGFWLAGISAFEGDVIGPYYLEFFAGAAMFHLYGRTSNHWPGLQCGAALGLYLLVSAWLDRHLETPHAMLVQCFGYGLMGALLISGAIGAQARYLAPGGRAARILSRVGDASYSLYLSHWFVLSALGKIGGLYARAPLGFVIAWQAASIIIAIVVATIFAERIELPLHRRLSRWLKRSAKAVEATVVAPRHAPASGA